MFTRQRWSVMLGVAMGVASAGLCVPPMTALAEQQESSSSDRVTEKVQHLRQQLDLTDTQAVQVQQILSASQAQKTQGQSTTPQDRQARWQQVQDQINGVLTPEQQAKYAQMQQDRHGQHQGHRRHRDAAGGAWNDQGGSYGGGPSEGGSGGGAGFRF